MGRFNSTQYSPKNDSTEHLAFETGSGQAAVRIVRGEGLCECGCLEPSLGKKSRFRIGHDSRFKGILLRAHLTGTDVALVNGDTEPSLLSAMAVARTYNTESYSWTGALESAKQRVATAKPSAKQAAPTGPQVGDYRTVKVGRWEYTGQIVKIDGQRATVEYASKQGGPKTVEVALSPAV